MQKEQETANEKEVSDACETKDSACFSTPDANGFSEYSESFCEETSSDTKVLDAVQASDGEDNQEAVLPQAQELADGRDREENQESEYNEEANGEAENQEEVSEEDYRLRAEEDMREIARLFPELSPDGEAMGLCDLRNPTRFAELRDAGLSVEEAFLASNYRMLSERPTPPEERRGQTTHLRPALPRSRGRATLMPTSLLLRSRTLFEGLSDSELTSLYRRVTE